MKSVLALRHVCFENLGIFEQVLGELNYEIHYHDVGSRSLVSVSPRAPDLLVVLGGPIAVYEADKYPCLLEEIAFVKHRLQANKPTLGICLGAQLIAAATGARVMASGIKEIGFSSIELSPEGHAGPLRYLDGVPVLHWHGDTFEMPQSGIHLARSEAIDNQAFAIGNNVLGLQFHVEADVSIDIEPWLIGHAAELAAAGIDPRQLRADARRLGPTLKQAAKALLVAWLTDLDQPAANRENESAH